MKPLNKISAIWSKELAYCIGLIASDGNLSKDGRHIAFVSKDIDQIETYKRCLGLTNKIGLHSSTFNPQGILYNIQFGDIIFYKFLISIGLFPANSKTLGNLIIPQNLFFHFLRGSFDGDGSFYFYWDKRWRSSFLYYLSFISASLAHIEWLKSSIKEHLNINGHVDTSRANRAYQLKYAKKEAYKIIEMIYKDSEGLRLDRKYKKVYNALEIDKKNNSARVL